jgi:hypothetical protein
MASQPGKLVRVAYKEMVDIATPPGASDAKVLVINPGPGLKLSKTPILPNAVRADGLGLMARHGSVSVAGSYPADIVVGGLDDLLEAAMRDSWQAPLELDEADFTSITTTSDTIVAASGSWITLGLRVGDVIRLTDHSTAANNGRNLRIKALTATTITLHRPVENGVEVNPLTANATPDTDVTITRLKKLTNNADAPVRRMFRFEQHYQGIDASQVFDGCRVVGFTITGSPDGMATIEFQMLGAKMETLEGANAPYFTSPAVPIGDGLVFSDARISVGGVDIAVATAFELTYQITAATLPVVGSQVSPDVYDNDAVLSGSFSLARQSLANVNAFVNETEFELHVLLRRPGAEPQDCLSLFVPRIKFNDNDAPLGADGPMIESAPWNSGQIRGVSGYDTTLLTMCTSSAFVP